MKPCSRKGSLKNCRKLSNPMNSVSVNVQRVREK
jgi:hypothetical protein